MRLIMASGRADRNAWPFPAPNTPGPRCRRRRFRSMKSSKRPANKANMDQPQEEFISPGPNDVPLEAPDSGREPNAEEEAQESGKGRARSREQQASRAGEGSP